MTDKNTTTEQQPATKEEAETEAQAADGIVEHTSKGKIENKNEAPDVSPATKTPRKKVAPTATKKTMRQTNTANNNKLSKTAVVALILALAGIGGVAGIHWLHGQENIKQQAALVKQIASQSQQNKQAITQQLNEQQTQITEQVQDAINAIQQSSQTRISQLEQQIARLEQNQPSDWLLHEAEYLTRIASRTLWLEQDTAAAINLLADADNRIKQLNDPQYLPVRQVIHQDIEALKLLPKLETEEVILALLALGKQIEQLSFAMAKVPESQDTEDNLQLTEDAADWRDNLAKTWKRFLADFITVRRRTGQVEPLMSPQHQHNLKENLALKLQQIQWAANKKNAALYQQSIDEVQLWLSEYFDLGHLATAKFYQEIQLLKNKIIAFERSITLNANQTLRQQLEQNQLPPPLEQPADVNKKPLDGSKQQTHEQQPSASIDGEVI